jgi:multidrug efflux pump subunit AcrB
MKGPFRLLIPLRSLYIYQMTFFRNSSIAILLFFLSSCTQKKPESRLLIITNYEGASPEVMEQSIAGPIEKAMNDLKTASASSSGKCVITVSAEIPLDSLRFLVKARMPDNSQLPKAIDPPVIRDYSDPTTSVIRYILKSETMPLVQLRKWNEEVLATELSRQPKVKAAFTVGSGELVLRVSPDLQKLETYGIGVDKLAQAIDLAEYGEPYSDIRAKNGIKTTEELQSLVIRSGKNGILLLKDLARVSVEAREGTQAVSFGDQPVIEGVVVYSNDLSVAEMEKQFYTILNNVKKKMPAGVTVTPFFGTVASLEGQLQLKIQFPGGTEGSAMEESVARIQRLIADKAGVASVVSETGFSVNGDVMEEQCYTFYISTGEPEKAGSVESDLQNKLSVIPGINFWFDHHADDYPADYCLKIGASEKDQLTKAMEVCREQLNAAEGISTIHTKGNSVIPTLNYRVDREKMAQYGISSFGLQVELYRNGKTWERLNGLPIELKIPGSRKPENISSWKIRTTDGIIPLTAVMSLEMSTSPFVILHENRSPLVAICFTVKSEEALKILEASLKSIPLGQDVTLRLEKDR